MGDLGVVYPNPLDIFTSLLSIIPLLAVPAAAVYVVLLLRRLVLAQERIANAMEQDDKAVDGETTP